MRKQITFLSFSTELYFVSWHKKRDEVLKGNSRILFYEFNHKLLFLHISHQSPVCHLSLFSCSHTSKENVRAQNECRKITANFILDSPKLARVPTVPHIVYDDFLNFFNKWKYYSWEKEGEESRWTQGKKGQRKDD